MLLFVYGTLKRGHCNHRLMAGSRFIGPASTAPGFRLYDLGPFPGMVRSGAESVLGELYSLGGCALDELDDFEGVPILFTREEIPLDDGSTAWAYLYARQIPAGAPNGDEWPIA